MTDPRYDEQFRRGYAGPPVPPPVRASGSTPEPVAPERLHDDRVVPTPASVEQDADLDIADADRPREGETTRPFRRNPFAIGLLVAGILMLVVGVWLIDQSTSQFTDGYTPEGQALVQVESQLTAPVLTGGVVAIVAWLALGAIAASAHRRSTS